MSEAFLLLLLLSLFVVLFGSTFAAGYFVGRRPRWYDTSDGIATRFRRLRP